MKLIEENGGYRIRESESEIQRRIAKVLVMKGYLVIRFNSGAVKSGSRFISFYQIMNTRDNSGLPDLAIMKNGKILFIEVKSEKGRVRPSQKQFKELAEGYGIETFITDNWHKALEFVENIK